MLPRSALLALLTISACAAPAPPAPSLPPPVPVSAPAPVPEPPPSPVASDPPPSPTPEPPPPPPRPRLTSRGLVTWIYGRPKADERHIGYIRDGSSVTLRSTDPRPRRALPRRLLRRRAPRLRLQRPHGHPRALTARFLETRGGRRRLARPAALPLRVLRRRAHVQPHPHRRRAAPRRAPPSAPPTAPRAPATAAPAYQDLAGLTSIEPDRPRAALPRERRHGGRGSHGPRQARPCPRDPCVSFTRAFAAEGRTWLLSAGADPRPRGPRARLPPVDLPRRPPRRGRRAPPRVDARHGEAEVPPPALGRGRGDGRAPWPVRTFVRLTGAVDRAGGQALPRDARPDADGAPLYVARGRRHRRRGGEEAPHRRQARAEVDRRQHHARARSSRTRGSRRCTRR